MSRPGDSLPAAPRGNAGDTSHPDLRVILDVLKGLRYGSVEIVVQDSRIVQLERLEKHRLV